MPCKVQTCRTTYTSTPALVCLRRTREQTISCSVRSRASHSGHLFVMLANTTGGSGGILHHPGSVLGQCTHCSQHVKSTHFSVFFSTPRVFIEKFHMSWGELGRGPFYYGNVQDSENAPEIEILIQQKQIRLDCLYKSPAPPRRKKSDHSLPFLRRRRRPNNFALVSSLNRLRRLS